MKKLVAAFLLLSVVALPVVIVFVSSWTVPDEIGAAVWLGAAVAAGIYMDNGRG